MAITLDEGPGLDGYAGPATFTYQIALQTTQTITVSFMADCFQRIDPCIPQGADRAFVFVDRAGADLSAATEITADIWQDSSSGSLLLSKSLTGATITLPADDRIMFEVSATESEALDAGNRYIEIWVTISGDRYLLGKGPFKVIDTRKFDA